METFTIDVSNGHFGHKTNRVSVDGSQGIKANFCVACNEIVSYEFNAEDWNQQQAEEWITTNYNPPQPEQSALREKVDALTSQVARVADVLGLARQMKRVGDYQVQGFHSDFDLAGKGSDWSFDADDGNAILDEGGWSLYKQMHLVCDVSDESTPEKKAPYTYPIAKLVNGTPTYYYRAATTIYSGLSGGARAADLPGAVKEACLSTVKKVYKAFDEDTDDMELSRPFGGEFTAEDALIFQLARRTGVMENDKGWIRKPILRTGQWAEIPPGGSKPLELNRQHLEFIIDAFEQGAWERVSVPLGHSKAPSDNAGFVKAMEIEERDDGEYDLVAWIEFTNLDVEQRVREGSIWNCSVDLRAGATRPSDGKTFPLSIRHVALTNYPWVEDLEGFTASREYQLGGNEDMDPEVQAMLERLDEEGLDAEGVLSLLERKGEIEEQEQALLERKVELARERRKDALKEIRLALEGKHTVEVVSIEDGYRHYPAVVEATKAALEQLPLNPSIELSREGETVEIDLDEVILSIANAIPTDAMVSLDNPSVEPPEGNPLSDGEVTDEAVEDLAQEIGL